MEFVARGWATDAPDDSAVALSSRSESPDAPRSGVTARYAFRWHPEEKMTPRAEPNTPSGRPPAGSGSLGGASAEVPAAPSAPGAQSGVMVSNSPIRAQLSRRPAASASAASRVSVTGSSRIIAPSRRR